MSEQKKRRRRFGDRNDGRKLRTLDPLSKFTPYIMSRRSDSLNFFSERFDVSEAEKLCREEIKKGNQHFSVLHVMLAAYVRTISQRPALNRFISGQKIFSRNEIEVMMTVKKKMSLDGEETCIKVYFEPTDTIEDVYKKFNEVVSEAVAEKEDKSSFEKLNKVLSLIPGLLCRWTVKFLNLLDYFGFLPRSLTKLSPFHASMAITSMGSLGIRPIYHHIYDFGNIPIFIAYGSKQRECTIDEQGNITKNRYIEIKFVTDERICDGYNYASALKMLKKNFENPYQLYDPPEKVIEDID